MASGNLRQQFSKFTGAGGTEHFPDPFVDVATLAMPQSMRNALQWCFVPGTFVETYDGLPVPIEQIRVGDIIRNRIGEAGDVINVGPRHVSEDIVALTYGGLNGEPAHRVTQDHKFVVIPAPGRRKKPDRRDEQEMTAGEIAEGDYVVTPVIPMQDSDTARVSGYACGGWLAEGNILWAADDDKRAMGLRFTYGRDDEGSGVLSLAAERLSRDFDQPVEIYTPPSRPDVRLISLHDPEIPDWIVRRFGSGVACKKLSSHIWTYGRKFALALIAGWLDGDGWTTSRSGQVAEITGCTVSRALAYQLVRLSQSVGLCPSVTRAHNNKGYGGSFSFQLTFRSDDLLPLSEFSAKLVGGNLATRKQRNLAFFVEDGWVYRRVREAELVPYDGQVYNIEVKGEHSYIANGVATRNCEYIYTVMGTYRMAMERIISYFLTDVEIGEEEADDEERDKWEDYLEDTLDIYTVLQNLLRDRMCYGNSFSTMLVPFKRFLVCPKCGSAFPLKVVYETPKFGFHWTEFEFHATCVGCQRKKKGTPYRGRFRVDDKPADQERSLRIKRWSAHEIEILHDTYTDEVSYLWRIPEDYKQQIRKGNLFHLERVSMPVLDAIKKNQMFRFNPDVMFHMKEPTLAGIKNRGWGIPRILSNFRQIWYVQVLRRYNEAIALDYVIPFRLITPAGRQGAGSVGSGQAADPLLMFNAGDFRSQVMHMLRRRRRDPASWHVLPFPVEYQMMGGDANQLAPRDLIDQGTEQLLNDAGTPVELYKGTMQLQVAPVALRLFEATWHHLVHETNAFINWTIEQTSQILSWDAVDAKLKRVTIADDMQKQMAALQLMMGQQISGTTALSSMGFDWKAEQRRKAEEAREEAEVQARMQEEMEQAGFADQVAKGMPAGADPAAGGAPPGAEGGAAPGGAEGQPAPPPSPVTQFLQSAGPNTPQTPADMMAAAEQIAQELLGLPDSLRRSELMKLKKANEVLHSIVMERLKAIRQEASSQGKAMILGQQQQQPTPA